MGHGKLVIGREGGREGRRKEGREGETWEYKRVPGDGETDEVEGEGWGRAGRALRCLV